MNGKRKQSGAKGAMTERKESNMRGNDGREKKGTRERIYGKIMGIVI